MQYKFFIIAIFSMLLFGCSNDNKQEQDTYLRQAAEYDMQTKRIEEQRKKEIEEYNKQLQKAEEQTKRYDLLLKKWEEQAERFDKVLDTFEKKKI